MKRIVFCIGVAVFGIYGCTTSKKAQVPPTDVVEDEGAKPSRDEDNGSAQTTTERVKGVVKIEEDCGAVIEVIYGDVINRYIPLNLPEKFRKNDLSIKFALKLVENMKVATGPNCEAITGIISVSEITPVR